MHNRPAKQLFISYAHHDRRLADDFLERLSHHLKAARGYDYRLWRDTMILPGENWAEEIRQALETCDFGLLLTSPAFFASDFIRNEELIRFVPASLEKGLPPKRAIPVGLVRYRFDLIDTRGLSDQQVYRHQGRFYEECAGPGRSRFVAELFDQLVQATRKAA